MTQTQDNLPRPATHTLSVVLPNYNHAKFIATALDAMLQQTYQPDELIVIDDASTDNSVDIIESYLPRFRSARLLRSPQNRGVVANMNRGLQEAMGSLVYFAASDDVTYRDFFQRGVSLLTSYPQAALFSARSDILDGDGRNLGILPTPTPLKSAGYISPEESAKHLMKDDSWFMGNAAIYVRQRLLSVDGFPHELGSFTDGYVCRLLALKHGACFSPEILCAWRRQQGGFAWNESLNMSSTLRTIDAVREKISRENGVFPDGYFEKWKNRHLFATRRFSLAQRRHHARAKGRLRFALTLLSEAAIVPWLLLKYRPADVVTIARRRLQAMRPAIGRR